MFSVVIPTYNRLDLLRDAMETVRRQEDPDWELVVFDNCSTDDIAGHVASLGDSRIRYHRSDDFLPVTDSWNRAIDLATGDYITFLGDDDGLTPDYFPRIRSIIERFQQPEILYSAIYQYFHPGVAPWERQGYLADLKNGFFFVGKNEPFRLGTDEARRAVQGSISLHRNFTFNIQAFVFSSVFLKRLRQEGPIFQSPFPDYYMANIALARAKSVVVVPTPMSIAGVSQASFGYTLFNGLEDKGAQLLNSKLTADPLYPEVERFLLPGPLYNTNYILTMEHVSRNLRGTLQEQANFARYRRLQIYSLLMRTNGKRWRKSETGQSLWPRLSLGERLWARAIAALIRLSNGRLKAHKAEILAALRRRIEPYAFEPIVRNCDKGSFSRLIQVFEALRSGAVA